MRVARFISYCVLLLALNGALEAGQVKPPAVPKPGKVAAKPPGRAANQQAARELPAEQLRRFLNMPPEEREKNLSKLPPAQQQRMRNQLNRLDSMPPQQRERWLTEIGKLEKLSPERRQAVTREMQSITELPVPQRRAILHSPEFNRDFSPDEQEIIRERFTGPAR